MQPGPSPRVHTGRKRISYSSRGFTSRTRKFRSVRGKLELPLELVATSTLKTICAYADEARTHGRIVT